MPARVDGDTRLADSSVVLEHLDERGPVDRGGLSVHPYLDGTRLLGYTVAEHHPRLRCRLDASASRAGSARKASEVSETLATFTSGLREEGPPRVRRIRDRRLEWTFETGAIYIVQQDLENETIRLSVEYQ